MNQLINGNCMILKAKWN